MGEKFLSGRNCVVIIASFIISLTTLGTSRLATVMFVATITRYETGRKQASFPFFLSSTMRCLTGPLVGYLGQKFGSEIVTVFGCVLSTIGVGTCFLAEDFIGITISWGFIYGLGLGLATSLIPEILNKNFVDHIDKANGMFLGGECFGAVILPSITFILLETYGTSGTFLILSGIMLHSVPAAMILLIFKHKENSSITSQSLDEIDAETNDVLLARESSLKPRKTISDKTCGSHSSLPKLDHLENNSSEICPISRQTMKTIEDFEERPMIPTTEECTKGKMFRVFLDPTFILIVFIQSSMQFALSTIFTIAVDFFKDVGTTVSEEVYLLMGFAISDTIGRFTLGNLTDAGFLTKINFYILFHALVGSVVASFVLVHGFVTTLIVGSMTGLCTGGLMMISPGIVSLYIQNDDVMMAIASRFSFYPLMSLAQPFLIEYFRENLGSYKGLLCLVAGLNFICGLLSFLIPVTARLREKRKTLLFKTDQESSFGKSEEDS